MSIYTQLVDAISNRCVVTLTYDDLFRVVAPAALGHHRTTKNVVLRGYQTDGQSASRTIPHWKLFTVDKIEDLRVTGDPILEAPPGYNPDGDADIHPLVCQLVF